MKFRFDPLPIPGSFLIETDILADNRGCFVKLFQSSQFSNAGLEIDFAEEYYSVSSVGVIRGLHFQIPPADHVKVVHCIYGSAFDVVVDLRVGSPTYQNSYTTVLSENDGRMIYIPRGCAHGFQALADETIVHYRVSSEYAPLHDAGIRWDSANIQWPKQMTSVSDRDMGFPSFGDFHSPFKYERRR